MKKVQLWQLGNKHYAHDPDSSRVAVPGRGLFIEGGVADSERLTSQGGVHAGAKYEAFRLGAHPSAGGYMA